MNNKTSIAGIAAAISLAIGTGAVADTISFGDYFFPGDVLANTFHSYTDDLVPYTVSGPGSGFTVLTEGYGWNGEFVRNTTLIYDNRAPGSVTITFGSPIPLIEELAAEPNAPGPYTATLTAYDGAAVLGYDTYTDDGFGLEGSIPYFSFAAPAITSISIEVSNDEDGFAIGAALGIPEPSSWLMLLFGFAALGVLVRGERVAARSA